MAEKLGLNSQQAYAYYENRGNKITVEDAILLGKKLGVDLLKEYKESFVDENIAIESPINYDKPQNQEDNSKLVASLIESNKMLAQANVIYAESNLKLATNMERLTIMAEKERTNAERLSDMVKSDSDAQKGTDLTAFAIRAELLELQARMNKNDGLSRSLGEARSKVNRVFAEMKKDKGVIRNEDELGKIDKKTPA